MKYKTGLGSSSPLQCKYFNSKLSITHFTQDTIHILTKLRNRMLAPSILIAMGHKMVSVSHFKILISTIPKNEHGLVMSDVCPNDRQNYESLEKCMEPRVLESLKKNIPDSEGTIMYLQMCHLISSSFNDPNLDPLQRVYNIWKAIFFFRIWRSWIKKSNQYTLDENFITENAYSCIELNGHTLVQLLIKFRDDKCPEMFLPIIFNSQTCESTFRQFRSMTTINWTRINMNLLELMHLAGRIEQVNDIMYCRLRNSGISFPRVENKVNKMKFFDLL